jgi:DNA-binding MarR family transcriptional regulator
MPGMLDESLFFKLVRVVNLTARPFNEGIGRRHELSLSDWRVVTVVGGHPGSTASDVCSRTGMDKMSVSRAIVSLERRQRVVRKPDPSDGRRTLRR